MPEITPPPIEESPTNQPVPVEAPAGQPTAPDPSINPVEAEDDKEWEEATKEQYPGLKSEDAPADKPAEAPTNPDPNAAKVEDLNKPAEPAAPAVDRNALDVRMTQRQMAEEAEAIRLDVRDKMFPEEEIKDAQGNPIKSADELMQYEDPRTPGEKFTKEAAEEAWQVHMRTQQQQRAEQDKQVEQIASVNLALKDEADMVKDQYGAFLDANPGVKKEIFDLYQNTLVVDPKTGIVTKAPVSLLKFYNTAMKPYIHAAQEFQKAQQQMSQQAEQAKQQEEEKRRQTRADRSDVFSAGKTDTMSEEDKEWSEAATAVFGPLKGNK